MTQAQQKNLVPFTEKAETTIVGRVLSTNPSRIFASFRTQESRIQLTYGDLCAEGRRVASAVSCRRSGTGYVVIIMLPQGPALMTAFFGTMLAGNLPSLFPTDDSRVHINVLRQGLEKALQTSGAKLLITDEASKARFFAEQDSPVPVVTPPEWALLPADFSPQIPAAESVAFLQHSSGTTGQKKGVAITHRALLAQTEAYAQSINLQPDDVIVSWLPLYHDMGLIACLLLPMVQRVPVVTLDPFEWVSNPVSLLHAISEEGGTLAWMPNFAYLFMANRVRDEDLEGVHLDSLRALVNCAEPVTAEAHRAFAERFSPLGFRQSALSSSYAMAENTFAVTQNAMGQPPRAIEADTMAFLQRGAIEPARRGEPSRSFVSSGRVIPNTQVRIVDPDTRRPQRDAHIGEVALTSDCMLECYFHAPELSAAAISDGWYHTGDLGFIDEGELFVTGRKKDMIIVAGKNLYPQDVETIAAEVPGVHPGRVVAFGVFDEDKGTEDLVILAETKDEHADSGALSRAIQANISSQLQCSIHRVAIVKHGSLLKSTSGKISRNKCREAFLGGAFDHASEAMVPVIPELDSSADANSALKRVYPLAAALELLVQFAALALPALLLLNAPTHPLLLVLSLMGAFYAYVLALLILVGGISRLLPRPETGLLEGKHLARWALLISVHMLARRGPARWYGWCFPPAQLYLRLCGARIAPNVMVSSLDEIPEPYLVDIGAGTHLGADCLLSAHYVPRIGEASLNRITIGKNVLVGRGASIWGGVTIGDGAVVQERASVMPGTVIPPGEIWGGIPARALVAQPAQAVRVERVPRQIADDDVGAFIQQELQQGSGAKVDPSMLLADTGVVDSLSYLSLIQRVEQRFRVVLNVSLFSYRSTSVDDLARATAAQFVGTRD
ncbi:MAG: AMP-binding protein [Deltaproteobacteria bacterium]|nr:AMP-binding protein [Deltaproteobacteria bacterium]